MEINTDIPTPNGMRKVADLKKGDQIYDELGQPCRVTNVTEVMFDRPCYKMKFSCGTEVICDEEHLWVTRDDKARISLRNAVAKNRMESRPLAPKGTDQSYKRTYPSPKTTGEIARTLHERGRRNHYIPTCGAVAGTTQDLPVHPYVLGAWLGDGRTDYASITDAEGDVVARIASLGYTVTKQAEPYQYGIVKGLVGNLRKLGVLGNKHIPRQYLDGDLEQRTALMQGLMDTDGYCGKKGHCELTSVNEELAKGVCTLSFVRWD